jgi:hypothetical protein
MDSTAISLCKENRLPILVFNMLERNNIRRVVCGEAIGTLVCPDGVRASSRARMDERQKGAAIWTRHSNWRRTAWTRRSTACARA